MTTMRSTMTAQDLAAQLAALIDMVGARFAEQVLAYAKALAEVFTVEVDPVMQQLLGPALARSIEAPLRRSAPRTVRAEIESAATKIVDSLAERAAAPIDAAVEEPTSAPVADPAEPKKRSTMKCKKCGALGFRSDGCGRTHNVARHEADDDEDEDDDEAPPATPKFPTSRVDRFARIEAAASARRGGAAR